MGAVDHILCTARLQALAPIIIVPEGCAGSSRLLFKAAQPPPTVDPLNIDIDTDGLAFRVVSLGLSCFAMTMFRPAPVK